MSKSIFSLGKHRQNLSRNAFDLSRKALFTAPSGALLPVFSLEVQPNDHVKLDMASFTRTAPLNSAAYVRVNEQVDFFFVPYRLLWSMWPQFISRTNEYSSMLFANHMADRPFATEPGKPVNNSRVANMIPRIKGSDIFDVFFAKTKADVTPTDPNYIGEKGDLFGIKKKYNAARLLNLLGYGFDGLDDGLRIKFSSGSVSGSTPTPNNKDTTHSKERGGFGGRRDERAPKADVYKSQTFNPFRLLAYQKIYNDYYRRNDYISQDLPSFNCDNASMNGYIDKSYLGNILEMRYLPLKRDYFTNVYPSNLWLGGIVDAEHGDQGITDPKKLASINNFLGMTPLVGTNKVDGSSTSSPFPGSVVAMQPQNINFVDTSGGISNTSAYTTASIRNAYAIEKLLTLMNVAGKNYRSQMETRWGIQTHSDFPDHALYLGSHNSKIQINEVVSTSDSENSTSKSSLGEIVGRGLGAADGHVLDFDAKEHGVILGIYSNYSETTYNSHGVDPFNFKFGFADYYQPEFDNLGMQPLIASAIFNDDPKGDRGFIGWQPRYSEYKTALDKVYGGFQSNGSKSIWTAPLLVENFKKDDGTYRSVNIRDLSVNPHTLESIFAIKYDGTSDSDAFLVDVSFKVTKVSSMSVLGEPMIS